MTGYTAMNIPGPGRMAHYLALFFIIVLAFCNGCTRIVEIPKTEYKELSAIDKATYRINLHSGATYVVKTISYTSSFIIVLEIDKAPGLFDTDGKPDPEPIFHVLLEDIASIEKINKGNAGIRNLVVENESRKISNDKPKKKRTLVETGFLYGRILGRHSRYFSNVLMNYEVGYLRGARSGESSRGWGFGGTILGSLGENDVRFGIKPRLRYRFHPKWCTDISAGILLGDASENPSPVDVGFVGGVGLNYSSWLTLESDIMVKKMEPYQKSDPRNRNKTLYFPAATEVSVYGGIAFRGLPGWITTGAGLATIAIVTVLFIIALSSMSFGT